MPTLVIEAGPTRVAHSIEVRSRDELVHVARGLANDHVASNPNLYGLFNADATNGEKLREAANREAIDIANGLWGKPTPAWHRSRCAGEIMMLEDE